jgi:hypothetical protein
MTAVSQDNLYELSFRWTKSGEQHRLETAFGAFRIDRIDKTQDGKKWSAGYCFAEYYDEMHSVYFSSLKEAKAWCERELTSRALSFLKPVTLK